MTLQEQRRLFEVLTPKEFMGVCIDQTEKFGSPLAICSFINIRIRGELGETLSKKEIEFKNKLFIYFGDLDISKYRQFYPTENDAEIIDPMNILKDIYSELLEGAKKDHNPNVGIDHSGFIAFVKAQKENLDFSKKDRKSKGIKYDGKRLEELFESFNNFKGKTYLIDNNIKITLNPKQFTHILVGHLEGYKIPRKGKLVQFDDIDHWKDLLAFIDKIIDSIKNDIAVHYNKSRIEYNNTNIKIENNLYGLHIGKDGDIRTLYKINIR